MSLSLRARPYELLYGLGAIDGIINLTNAIRDGVSASGGERYNLADCNEKLFNSEIKTTIMDESLLLKTLEEHSAKQIYKLDNAISCNCEEFHLEFKRSSNDEPYILEISYNQEFKAKNFVKNISAEYASNAQEYSYQQITQRLEQQNLEIEDEEIYDDNTIVLTVSLE